MKPARAIFCDDCIETFRAERPLSTCGSLQPEVSPRHIGYRCTRPQGHSGNHVACHDEAHQLAKWPNLEDQRP
jgi:hypothetical protein